MDFTLSAPVAALADLVGLVATYAQGRKTSFELVYDDQCEHIVSYTCQVSDLGVKAMNGIVRVIGDAKLNITITELLR